MALLGAGGLPLGFLGLQTGLQYATGQNNLLDARNAIGNDLANQFEQNIRVEALANGATSPEVQAQLGLYSPFRNQANSNLQSALGAQRALAPQALAQAGQGNFDSVNRLLGYFGPVGNFNQQNFNPVDAFGLLGGQGIAAQTSLNRSDPLQALQLQALQLRVQQLARQEAESSSANPFSGGPTFGSGFGDPLGDDFFNIRNTN